MRWNAVAGVLWLLVGGITALLVILTRWPAIKLLPADQFYLILTAHGIDMLILWILFFEMAVLYFASSTLLRCRLATPKIAWLGFWLMVVGGIMTNIAIFQGESSVMFTSYVPMQAAPHFYLGIILVAVGALLGCRRLLRHAGRRQARQDLSGLAAAGHLRRADRSDHRHLHHPRRRRHPDPDLPLVGRPDQGNRRAVVPHGVVGSGALVAADQRRRPRLDLVPDRRRDLRRQAAVEKVSRFAFLLYILFLQLASAHHLLSDPA
jgi:cytochrome c oxidase subunit 1